MKAPPKWKIGKMFRVDMTLYKVTETEIVSDDEFGQTEETLETYDITGEIQSITLEDIAYLPAGEVSEGDVWGFFLPSYTIEGEEITVEVNDYITFRGVKYLLQRIDDFYDSGEIVYRRGFMKRQVGQ